MLAGVGYGRSVLVDVYAGRLSGLKEKLVYIFKLVADMVREFVYANHIP